MTGTLNAAVFYNDFRNQQIQLGFESNPMSATIEGNPFAAPQNAGKSRIYGAEVDSSVRLFAGARLDASYSYLSTRIQAVNLPTLPLPETIGSVTLAATDTHTSRQLTNYPDQAEPALAQFSYLKALNLLNLNLNWTGILGKPVDLSIFATNVTRQEYYTFCGGLGGAPPGGQGFDTCQIGAPLMVGARVKIRYN